MLKSPKIAGHVFNGVKFSAKALGKNSVKVIMENNDYPIEHFQGFFQAWMEFSGHKGKVDGLKISDTEFEYKMNW
jgi:hypothetical protein